MLTRCKRAIEDFKSRNFLMSNIHFRISYCFINVQFVNDLFRFIFRSWKRPNGSTK